ncbi:hypothetical protein M9H77_27355 [Catharanthus roseus]|uniref:Uncharacterized protein n=1 Tax=Catharanthus roseus TaxID=4058 RepID=A0ACC0AEZ0_CATRO|nr:hypothetical protein M9H77_27355 [Catharanthus roseus]
MSLMGKTAFFTTMLVTSLPRPLLSSDRRSSVTTSLLPSTSVIGSNKLYQSLVISSAPATSENSDLRELLSSSELASELATSFFLSVCVILAPVVLLIFRQYFVISVAAIFLVPISFLPMMTHGPQQKNSLSRPLLSSDRWSSVTTLLLLSASGDLILVAQSSF